MAIKDEAGNFTWVEFEPKFRSHLFKCAFSLLGKLITPAAQRMYKKAIFVYILEILNQEGEDALFTSKHSCEKTARANWKRKQTPPPSEPAPQANAEECQDDNAEEAEEAEEEEAETDQQVEALTPEENPPAPPALPENNTVVAQQPPPTPAPAEPIPVAENTDLTPIERFMHWWTEANPGSTLMCEGTATRQCNNPATHVKIHGSFTTACYPKCDHHTRYDLPPIPKQFL